MLLLSKERGKKSFLGWEDEDLWYRANYMLIRNIMKWCKRDPFSAK